MKDLKYSVKIAAFIKRIFNKFKEREESPMAWHQSYKNH